MGPRDAPRQPWGKRATAFARRLTTARRALGLTQQQAADQVGVGLATWQRWESGDTAPRSVLAKRAVGEFIAAAKKK
jgi:transcriptional regulator with XRE-family HTH domain